MTTAGGYVPPPEAAGGWRWLRGPDEVREVGGFDPERLAVLFRLHDALDGGHAWSIAIIRHGWLVREQGSFNVAPSTRFDTWSVTKSVTALAWGLLLQDAAAGRLAPGLEVSLDTPAYSLLAEGRPLTDPRKERITVRHLLTMTSGIPGEASGLFGIPSRTDAGPFEHALGRAPNRYDQWAGVLNAEPGTRWEYSDAAYAHLSMLFARVAGREIADYLQERVFIPLGMAACWDAQGGSGFLGPHTNAHTGFHVSARDLARLGYLALCGGRWGAAQVVPAAWIDLVRTPSQPYNAAYGYGWWTNRENAYIPGLPADLFALAGYAFNRCYIVPSLDLVVARVGSGPPRADERGLIAGVIEAVVGPGRAD